MKKYQIFVSSTFRDLAEERQDAIRSILDLGHIPAGMELFPASDTLQLDYIKKVIDECDYYVLIMGGRYGSLDSDGVSYTEREYDYAVDTGKIILAFPHGDLASIPVGKSDTAERMQRNLEQFRLKVMGGRLVREWTTREQLDSLVVKALVRAISDYPAIGWIRGDAAASEELLQQINDLRLENDALSKNLTSLKNANRPQISGLAGLNETVHLQFYKNKYYNGKNNKINKSFTFTWQQVFKAVSTKISYPKSTELIGNFINSFRKERDKSDEEYYIFDSDQAIVKNQLVALGLINVYVAKILDKGALHEFMSLTDLGRVKLAEILAVRSSKVDMGSGENS